jgi:hypothetical protein
MKPMTCGRCNAEVAAILAIVLVLASTVAGQEKGTRALLSRAEKGDAEAQFSLGLIYHDGQEEAQDQSEAVRWFRMAADRGHVAAQFNLGIMYSDGSGVAKDPILAHMWFSLAALHAVWSDKKKFAAARDWIARQMSPQQIAEAQRRAREWKCCTLAPVQSEGAGPLRATTASETRQTGPRLRWSGLCRWDGTGYRPPFMLRQRQTPQRLSGNV